MQRVKSYLVASSFFLIVAGCNNIPAPKGESCVMFYDRTPPMNLCYDMEKDFTPAGDVKPEARPRRYEVTEEYLRAQRRVNFDPQSYANLKAFILKQKQRCEAK